MKQFMKDMGNLQIEAYNEAIDDIISTIKVINITKPENEEITIRELIETIKLLKIN